MAVTGVTGGISDISGYASYHKSYTLEKNTVGSDIKGAERTSVAESGKSADNTGLKSRTATEYTRYLNEKFSYMNKSTTMEGVPTTVSVSPAFIAKCANDPEKAKFLEENLAALPGCAKSAVAGTMGTLTNLSYNFDSEGNISIMMSGSSDPDGKIAKANAERKAKETKEKEETAKEKRAEKKEAEEKLAEKLMRNLTKKLEFIEKPGANAAVREEEFSVSIGAVSKTVNTDSNFNFYS